MKRWTRSVAAVALVVLGATGLLLDGALAKKFTKSTVTISSGRGSQFTGKVASHKMQCRAGRTVKLYLEGGPSGRHGDKVVGTANTDARGNWAIFGGFLEGIYYAGIARVVVHSGTATYRCGADWSPAAPY
ncbi:MAG TPA: hypothetical protein VF176_06070 [Solirubrobacterales bacterium]